MGEDEGKYRGNTVYGMARANRDPLARLGTQIYFDCGSADEFSLHDGATYLHEVLTSSKSLTSSVRWGSGDADGHVRSRQAEAIRFIGSALLKGDARPPGNRISSVL